MWDGFQPPHKLKLCRLIHSLPVGSQYMSVLKATACLFMGSNLGSQSGRASVENQLLSRIPAIPTSNTRHGYTKLKPPGNESGLRQVNSPTVFGASMSLSSSLAMVRLSTRHNPALNLAPFSRWTLRDKAAQRRLALR